MFRTQILAVAAGMGVLLTWAAPAASGAPFAVYYRSSAVVPWTFYVGTDTKAVAQVTATELTELGYLTQIINDAEPVVRGVIVAPGSTTIVNGVVGGYGRGGGFGYGYSSSASSYSGYAGSSSSHWSNAGSTYGSVTTHHWDHQHHYSHGKAGKHSHNHPTRHPHHNAHHHHGHHGHHHHGHHAHHHGGHHQHHHAHHHSQGHHHK